MKTNFGRRTNPLRSMYVRVGTTLRRPRPSYTSVSRVTKPADVRGANSTEPVTMRGFWYSSPMRFQYAVLANSRSYGSRSFCSRIFCGRAEGWPALPAFLSTSSRSDTRLAAASVSAAALFCSCAISMSVIGSASITRSDDFERSWLRSRRTVSWLVSSSSLPPATKPATSTRWNAETSSLALIGVSIGTSNSSPPQATASTAQAAAIAPSARRLLVLLRRAIIDFFEQLVVLTDLGVVWIHLHRLFV